MSFRGNLIAYINKKKVKYNEQGLLTWKVRGKSKLERNQSIYRMMKIINIRKENNKIKNKYIIEKSREKINKAKIWFFSKINKMGKCFGKIEQYK